MPRLGEPSPPYEMQPPKEHLSPWIELMSQISKLLEIWGPMAPCSSSCRGLGGPLLSGGKFVFLYLSFFLSFCTLQYSNRRGGWCQGWLTPYSTPWVVSVWQVLQFWWQNVELTFCSKKLEITFFKSFFGALPKISDWIRKYVQIPVWSDGSWLHAKHHVHDFLSRLGVEWLYF